MKVAHIVCVFPPYKGGMGNSAFNFVKILSEIGYDTTVFTPDYGGVSGGAEEKRFRTERIRPLIKFGNAAFLPQLFWKLKDFNIIHLHYPFYGAEAAILLRKLIYPKKTKLIIHYHMEPTAGGLKGLVFALYRLFITPLLMRTASVITCASIDYIKYSGMVRYYKRNKSKFREVPFGVDINRFRKQETGNRKQETRKNILFVGGLDKAHYFKGVDILLKALPMLHVTCYMLHIVGDGDLRPRYEKLARELGIGDKVNFIGMAADDDLPKHYQQCEIFVLPSINRGEAFGMVLLEAMACGKPVVASDLPGVRSVFENRKQGLLVEPGNAADLAEKIRIILSDDDLAKKMGEEGKKLVEEKYIWEKVGERLDAVYKV